MSNAVMSDAVEDQPQLIWMNVIFLTLTPLMVAVLVPLYLWFEDLSWSLVITSLTLWWVTGLSITAGYHRLFSHRSYKAGWPLKLFFAILGASTWQNSIIEWCSDHRRHHRGVDTEEDPYNANRGFWWSHIGWILFKGRHHGDLSNVKDLLKDPICAWQHNHYMKISIAFNIGVPVLLGMVFDNIWGMLLFATLVRVVSVHHLTFFINSLAHMWGKQPWSNSSTARDSALLSYFTFGEGYHNYHHAFETDYRNGRRWFDYDPAKWLIYALSHTGMTHDIRRIPDDMILRRRFEERRSAISESFEAWGQRIDVWREEMWDSAAQAQEALRSHIARAEGSIEEALADLKQARAEWQAARNTGDKSTSRSEIRNLKQAMHQAKAAACARMDEWEQLISDGMVMMAPAPA